MCPVFLLKGFFCPSPELSRIVDFLYGVVVQVSTLPCDLDFSLNGDEKVASLLGVP